MQPSSRGRITVAGTVWACGVSAIPWLLGAAVWTLETIIASGGYDTDNARLYFGGILGLQPLILLVGILLTGWRRRQVLEGSREQSALVVLVLSFVSWLVCGVASLDAVGMVLGPVLFVVTGYFVFVYLAAIVARRPASGPTEHHTARRAQAVARQQR